MRLLMLAAAVVAALIVPTASASAGEPSIYNYLIHRVTRDTNAVDDKCVAVAHFDGPDDWGVSNSINCYFDAPNLWYQQDGGNGTVLLRNRASGRYMQSPATTDMVTAQPRQTSDLQRWTLKYSGITSGNYNLFYVINVGTGFYLTSYLYHDWAESGPIAGGGQLWAIQAVPVAN